jgi:hypothetical protein
LLHRDLAVLHSHFANLLLQSNHESNASNQKRNATPFLLVAIGIGFFTQQGPPPPIKLTGWRPPGFEAFIKTGEFNENPMIGFLDPDDAKCNKEGIEWFPTGTARWQRNTLNFIIAGAPKAGTTSLSCLLKQHNTVFEQLDRNSTYFATCQLKPTRPFMSRLLDVFFVKVEATKLGV